MAKDKGQEQKGKLPSIVLEMAGMVSWLDQNQRPAGPMQAVAMLGRRAKQMLELADDETNLKFAGIVLLRDFAERVIADYEATWKTLDALEAGKLIPLPKDVQEPEEPKEPADDANPDRNGKDEASGPART